MVLDPAYHQLGWPNREEVFRPSGSAALVIADSAAEKIGNALSRRPDGVGIQVGILSSDPHATEAPLAIVCEFPRKVSDETLHEAQRLAWNFGRAQLLVTIEPHIIRQWTCCELPVAASLTLLASPEIEPAIDRDPDTGALLSEDAAASLHWVELITGRFFRRHEDRFRPQTRADHQLLSNLRDVRKSLIAMDLDDDISHDLLARIIFIQFLFDRKDAEGRAALNIEELERLHRQEHLEDRRPVLSRPFTEFAEILASYDDAYRLFRWLNGKFNGDLFPGKGTAEEQEQAWQEEQRHVRPKHLELLARFVSGQERMDNGQLGLWPFYAFDAIPLDFISTIYEQFVKKDPKKGVHYTPSHVVDLVLDSILPWDDDNWDLRILDPACGSGVFLVKAFQRLSFRWKRSHPGEQITGDVLGKLLEENLFGVDPDPHAVRVASFSLYLALCDEIDPRDYWKEVHFPVMRGRRLVTADFFQETQSEIASDGLPQYDIVIGNPPWGKNSATRLAKLWSKKHEWPLCYGDMGPLFLAKALRLTVPGGAVGLVQPASTLLYNSTANAEKFRQRLFSKATVAEIINLAAFRRKIFRDAIVPACIAILENREGKNEPFWYICPKPRLGSEDAYRITIEPDDVQELKPDEALHKPWAWSTLLWGGRRDLAFIERLRRGLNLNQLEANKVIKTRQGIIRSNSPRPEPEIAGRRLLEPAAFPLNSSITIQASNLPVLENPQVDDRSSHDYGAFELPQLVIKQSWMEEHGRFRAALIVSDLETRGVIATDSYLSVHAFEGAEGYLDSACVAYNSRIAVYFLLLTSGRFAMDRNEPQVAAFRGLPLPTPRTGLLDGVSTVDQVDAIAREAYDFHEAEWMLIDHLVETTLPDIKEGDQSLARRPTRRHNNYDTAEPELTRYCEVLTTVFREAYGHDKLVGSVILSEDMDDPRGLLPVRLVSLYLNVPTINGTLVETLQSVTLRDRLTKLYRTGMTADENQNVYYQRCARTYETINTDRSVPGVVVRLVKPDQVRYWTVGIALRDADAIAADLRIWAQRPNVGAGFTGRSGDA